VEALSHDLAVAQLHLIDAARESIPHLVTQASMKKTLILGIV